MSATSSRGVLVIHVTPGHGVSRVNARRARYDWPADTTCLTRALKALDKPITSTLTSAITHPATGTARPAAFLDRDGTLNVDRGYVHRIDDFTWIDGAREAIGLLNAAGYLVFIVTNQSGVARGLYDCRAVESLHRRLLQDLADCGARVDEIRYCPHHPEGKVEAFSHACHCRKPEPGMLLDLAQAWQPDLASSFILGDSPRDIEAGRRAGIGGYLVESGNTLAIVQHILAQSGH